MRALPVVALMIFVSSAAIAQTANPATPPPAATPPAAAPASPAAQGITRDDYIKKAQDRAAKAAAKRFDAMDADHDGILTPDEIAAYRAAHGRKKAVPPQQQ